MCVAVCLLCQNLQVAEAVRQEEQHGVAAVAAQGAASAADGAVDEQEQLGPGTTRPSTWIDSFVASTK